jgi:nitroreductase
MNNYLEALEWRYATKKYDTTKKVSAQDIETLKKAVRLSVSSIGLQPYKVFIIENPDVRAKLVEGVSGNNKVLVNDASHLFVFANITNIGDKEVGEYIDNIGITRGLSKDSLTGFNDYISVYINSLTEEQKNIWTSKQTYIALATLINTAALLKIDTTPMEGFDPAKVNEILGLDKLGLNASVIATVGYRHDEDAAQHAKKVRKQNEELFITL